MGAKRFGLAGLSLLAAFAGTAFAQLPPAPVEEKPAVDPVVSPPLLERKVKSPPMRHSMEVNPPLLEPDPAKSGAIKIEMAEAAPQGSEAFGKMLIESKAAYAKTRDYVGHIVRQERVNGTLQAEQTGEIRVRTSPFAIDVKMVLPKTASGWETAYMAGRKTDFIRYRPNGTSSMQFLKLDDPKALANTRHSILDTGLGAILARAEKMVEVEKKARNPVQIVVAEYKFEDKPCMRYDIYCEKPHTLRYAHRAVLYVDKETKLPVRWEAYDSPKSADPTGELLESYSFVNLKFNVGLSDSNFDK
jgi:hypothetical protein